MKMISHPYTYHIQAGDSVLACPDAIDSGYDTFTITAISTDYEPAEPLNYWGTANSLDSQIEYEIAPEEIVEIYPKAKDKPDLEFFEHDKTWRIKE